MNADERINFGEPTFTEWDGLLTRAVKVRLDRRAAFAIYYDGKELRYREMNDLAVMPALRIENI